MWESLIERNPNFMRFYKKNNDKFDNLMELAIGKGYIPSFSDLKRNYLIREFVQENKSLHKKIIEKEPRSITLIETTDENIIKLAISNGYKPTVSDVKQSSLSESDTVIRMLIKQNPNNIIEYTGSNQDLFDEALSLGWEPSEKDIIRNRSLRSNISIMRKMIAKDPSNILLCNGYIPELVKYALQMGYVPKLKDIKKGHSISCDVDIMHDFIRENPRNIIYYRGRDENFMMEAIELGYEPLLDDIKGTTLVYSEVIMGSLVRKKPENIIYYEGTKTELIKESIELGYRPTKEDIEKYSYLFKKDDVINLLLQKNPNYIALCSIRNPELIAKAINLGYVPTLEDIKKNQSLGRDKTIIRKLLSTQPEVIAYYTGNDMTLVDEALGFGYVPQIKDVEISNILKKHEGIMYKIIESDPEAIIFYHGKNPELFDFALKKGYSPKKKDIVSYHNLCYSDSIMRIMVEKDSSNIILYLGENQEIVELALKNGYKPSGSDLQKNFTIAKSIPVMRILLKEDGKNLNCYKSLGDDIMCEALHVFSEFYNVNIPEEYSEIFKVYKGDLNKFCLNYSKFCQFLNQADIKEEEFSKFTFSKSYDWLDDILKILDTNKIDEFKNVKEFFLKYYYVNVSNQQNISVIDSVLSIMSNYAKFPELCEDIINQNRLLTEEEIININMIFSSAVIFDEETKPKSLADLSNVVSNIKEIYGNKIKESVDGGITLMQDTLCQILFGSEKNVIQERLYVFGDTEVLRQLLFNNRDNPEIESIIREMMIYTSMMEDVLAIKDSIVMEEVVNRVLNNFEFIMKTTSKFKNYEESMRYLYEIDIQSNLTRFSNVQNSELIIDKERTTKYGVEVLDFSDKKYCLMAHVMSDRETPEELVCGVAINKKNFISLSSISHRNQVYYTKPSSDKIIFATDEMLPGLFIQSSVTNMGTNQHLTAGGGEIGEIHRTQRGILETSHAPNGNNSEVLAYRSGLKFGYIVLPGGREPTEKELLIAKEYGLRFVVTQEVDEEIIDPIDIDKKSVVEFDEISVESEVKTAIIPKIISKEKGKSIAILTDAHGLFEPTLAILEDARKRGITDIYSLGDNVGSGPNPSEVMELLDEYGVVSLNGNHELYVTLGVDAFKEHLEKSGVNAYSEAEKNSSWTSEQLTDSQKQKLKLYPHMIEMIMGGKKILLCHDIKDFNTGEVVFDPSAYDEVFRGHIHFGKKEGNVTTIPGVGIGNNRGKATYVILTEKEDGGYTTEFVTIGYDLDNLYYDINESDMDLDDKAKIEEWAGVSSGRKK
ncbi:MAG: metallophosphoesterase family protein [Firmicutes bacterium]|nr:metallophosphoesterase family protein [Bacillota bacterium]